MEKSVFEQNMEALRERFPGLAYKIQEHLYKIDEDIIIETEKTKDKQFTLKVTKDKRTLYTNGKYEPKKETMLIVDKIGKVKNKTPIFLLGMGNGMIIKELLNQTKEDVNIAVLEPSINIFLQNMMTIDLQDIFKKRAIGLVVEGLNEDEKEAIIGSFLTIGTISHLKKIIHPNYDELFPNNIVEDMKLIQKWISKIMTQENTVIQFSNVRAENLFRNSVYICDNYKADQICQVIPLDIPAIIVAAGPSLNKNIKELKRAKNKAFIIAVDTALKPLLKEGIVPDLFAIVDGQKPIELFYADGVKEIPMLTSIASAANALEYHTGKKFFYKEYFPYINGLFEDLNIAFREVATGGSVATTAFSFAYLSGFSTIILVGQDLAFTDNKTHADGTFKEVMDEIDTKNAIMVEGNVEPLVPTRMDFKMYLSWYNDYISKTQEVKVINATEGGAKIKNTEVMTLKEAIDRECNKVVNIDGCYKNLEPMFSEEQRKKAIEYFKTTPNMLSEIKEKAKEGKKLYKRLDAMAKDKQINRDKYKKLTKKIQKKVKEIEDMRIASIILECLGVANYLIRSEVYDEEESFEKEIKEIARKGSTVLDYVMQCADLFLPLVEETVCKIE